MADVAAAATAATSRHPQVDIITTTLFSVYSVGAERDHAEESTDNQTTPPPTLGISRCFLMDSPQEIAKRDGVDLLISNVTWHSMASIQVQVCESASWKVVELGLEQAAFGHSGFCGTLFDLLQGAANGVHRMSNAYSGQQRIKMREWIAKIDAVLCGSSTESISFLLRDPAGLSSANVLDISITPPEAMPKVVQWKAWRSPVECGELGIEYVHSTI